MTEGTLCVRAVNDRHQKRIRSLVRQDFRSLAVLVILGHAGAEIGFQCWLVVLIPPQHRVAFRQHIGHRVDDAGRTSAVDHLNGGITVRVPADIQKRAGSNQCRQIRGAEKNVAVVEPEDFIQKEVVVVEAVEHQPVRQHIHRLCAPAKRIRHSFEPFGNDALDLLYMVFHVIITVPEKHPRPLAVQLSPEKFHPVFRRNQPLS